MRCRWKRIKVLWEGHSPASLFPILHSLPPQRICRALNNLITTRTSKAKMGQRVCESRCGWSRYCCRSLDIDGANLRCLKPPNGGGRLCNVTNHGSVGKQSARPVDPRSVVQAMGPTPGVVPTATRNQTQQTAQGDNALILLIVLASLTPIQGLEDNLVSRWHHNRP